MIRVTTRGLKINRAATTWLIRRFIDPDATFVFVMAGDVAEEAARRGGTGFHAPGAKYPARDVAGRTPFEMLVDEHCAHDPALRLMSVLVKDADVPHCRVGWPPPDLRGLSSRDLGRQ